MIYPNVFNVDDDRGRGLKMGSIGCSYLILVTTATTGGGGKFFQVRGIFLTVNAKSSHER